MKIDILLFNPSGAQNIDPLTSLTSADTRAIRLKMHTRKLRNFTLYQIGHIQSCKCLTLIFHIIITQLGLITRTNND